MAIRYIVTKKKITVGDNPGERYLAKFVKDGVISNKELSEMIAHNTTVERGEVEQVLTELSRVMGFFMKQGDQVKTDLGVFRPTIKAKAMDTVEKADAKSVESIKVHFLPSTELEEKMKATPVKKVVVDRKGVMGE